MKKRRATEKDLERCLRLMNKWGKKIGRVGWAVVGELCRCKGGPKNAYAHLTLDDRAHIATLQLHRVDGLESTALHEQLHIELAEMGQVVNEIRTGGTYRTHREKAYEWYQWYEDRFIEHMTEVLLDMDKEIRSLKRKVKKLEKDG